MIVRRRLAYSMLGMHRVRTKRTHFPTIRLRRTIMKTLTITDLKIQEVSARNESGSARLLSREEMRHLRGGRAISVLVDGRPGGVVDDFQLNMEIFKGNIGGPMV
jgi:hypothetical protein